MPEDITINVGTSAAVPECPLPGHAWKRVVHDPTVTWLAYWKENVMQATKYVFLAASSSFKGKSDLSKYEKARKLRKHIDGIRKHYEALLKDEDAFKRQSGTAMWIIDRLALRVGGEKDEDEADTVGCCSLRVEHLSFPATPPGSITLDFLGKDSMRYFSTIDLTRYADVGALVYKNLRGFWKHKKAGEDIFDELTPSRLNDQLNELMPGLSAKVFRTYNASITLEKELENLSIDVSQQDKIIEYNRANREVAILCNHQRTVPKSMIMALEKMTEKEVLMKSQLEDLKGYLAKVKKGEKLRTKSALAEEGAKIKAPTLAAEKSIEAAYLAAVNAPSASVTSNSSSSSSSSSSASSSSSSSSSSSAASASAAAAIDIHDPQYSDARLRHIASQEAHMFSKQPTQQEVQKRIDQWVEKLEKLQFDHRTKDDNKAVALGTSKINYMDPRITVSWCKKVELPIEKVFPMTLLAKFPWAMNAPTTFTF
jgi:DNA topoisomerase-1